MSWNRSWMNDLIYADVGDKLNYAACVADEDDNLTFVAWIRKYCFKYGIKIKVDKKDLGL